MGRMSRDLLVLAFIASGLCDPVFAATGSISDYPAAAGANGEHGTVRLQLDVAENGHIAGCKIIRPSGAADLDGPACESVSRGSFAPSAQTGQRTTKFTVHYIIPEQTITDADLPIVNDELVIMYNPSRDEVQRRYGVTGQGQAHSLTRLGIAKSPTYPPEAKAAKHEGVVRAAVQVSKGGKPVACNVVRSSGYAELDEATCFFLMANARYTPGTDYYGMPIVDYDLVRMNWKIR